MRVATGRRFILATTALAVVGLAAAACSGGGGGGGGGGPSGSRTLTLDGANFSGDLGDLAFFRVFNGGNIAYCSSASIGGGSPSFEFVTPATLATNVNYTGELFVDLDANALYTKASDPAWKLTIGTISASTGNTISLDAASAQSPISWKGNKGCPGK